MICLDNDVFSRYASQQTYPDVSNYLADHANETWVLPSIVLFEYLQRFSPHQKIKAERRTAERAVDTVAPVDGDVSEQAANIRARLASAGTSLATPDLLIAAVARQRGCTLATRNKTDFDKPPIHQLMDVDIIQ